MEITLDEYIIFHTDRKSKVARVLNQDFLTACHVAAVKLPKGFEYIAMDIFAEGIVNIFTLALHCEILKKKKKT